MTFSEWIEHLREALREENGHLYWLARPESNFYDRGIWTYWNSQHAGKEAGKYAADMPYSWHIKYLPGIWYVTFDHNLYQRSQIVWALCKNDWCHVLEHINGDTMDDRCENLRPATLTQAETSRLDDLFREKILNYRENSHRLAMETARKMG